MYTDSQIDTFNRFAQVSRETLIILKKYEKILKKANESVNLIGNSTINEIWIRHFLDSYQVIDLIDKNDNMIVDLGSGAGLPGMIIAICAKDKNLRLKVKLVEKSKKKAKFLNETIKNLNLNVEVINRDITEKNFNLTDKVYVARAFKPLRKILELIHNKTENLSKFFILMGKTGKNELLEATKSWDIKYKQTTSITNSDSIILEINGLKKK